MSGSTPQTRGFDVSVMPQVQLANPAYFDAYGGIARGLSAGANMGSQLQNIILSTRQAKIDDQMQPLRMALMQGQVNEQPLHQALLGAQLLRAEQERRLTDIEMPGKEALARQPIKQLQSTFMDTDEYGNLNEYGSYKYINPETQEVTYTPRVQIKTVKTKEQLEQERLNNEAMRDYRTGLGAAAQVRAATAEQVASWKAANPTVKTKTYYDKDNNVFEQVINHDGSMGPSVQVMLPNGQPAKKPQTEMGGLAGALAQLSGASATPAQPPQIVAQTAAPAQPVFDTSKLSALASTMSAPAAIIQTKAQYDALPKGAVYVDAITGKRHVKGE